MKNRQQGSALLLTVGAVLVGLMAIWLLAWVPLMERSSRGEANLLVNRICDLVIRRAPLTKVMWNQFQDELKVAAYPENSGKNTLRYAQIISASLFVAGAGESYDAFPLAPAPGVDWRADPLFANYQVFGSPDAVVRDEIHNPQNNDEFISVEFHNSFRDAPISPYVVNDIRNYGNTAVCVINAKAKDSVLGITTDWLTRNEEDNLIHVVSGSWNPVQGVNSIPPLQAPETHEMGLSSSAGVILEIAPQLPELDLSGAVPGLESFLSGKSRFEPTDEALLNLPMATTRAFSESSPGGLQGTHQIPSVSLKGDITPGSAVIKERLIGCINPLAVARQAFTSTLAELMARDGQLRNSTEIILVNGRKFNSLSPANFTNEPWAPPAVIAPAGTDITQISYQLPYVAMKDFVSADSWSAALDEPGTAYQNWRTLLAGQLAHCAHVYANSEGTVFSSPLSSEVYSSFEPSELFKPQKYNIDNGTPLIWQRDSLRPAVIPLMSSFQVLAQLGNTRSCPNRGTDASIPASCRDGADLSQNLLYPDLEALSRYTSPLSAGFGLGGLDKNYALDAPGGLIYDASGKIGNGDFSDQIKKDPIAASSYNYPMQVLVMHTINPQMIQMLTDWRNSGRMNKLFQRSDSSLWGDVRPFRLVLFPATEIELDTMRDLATALGVTVSGTRAGLNRIIVIEPCEINDRGDKLYPDYCTDPAQAYTSKNLRNFWNAIVFDPDIKNNIYQRAEEFFRLHMTSTARIL